MEKELSYLSPDGFTIFTSQFLKNKGTCCKSNCLHCPYGFTIKKFGIKFSDVGTENIPLVEEILKETGAKTNWQSYEMENIKLIHLKDMLCGVLFKNHIVIKEFYLKKHFQDQNISKELVESYYFC